MTIASSQPGPRLNAAFYADSVAAFLRASDDEVYAPLASPHGYTLATLVGLNVATRHDEGRVTHRAVI